MISVSLTHGVHTNSFIELPDSGVGFYTYGRDKGHYGKEQTVKTIEEISEQWSNEYPEAPRIGIGDISLENGGKFPPHSSHRNGLDVDIRPMRNDGLEAAVTYLSPSYSREQTQSLVDVILSNENTKKILFNDPNIRGVQPYPNHDNHLHVQFKRK